MTYRIQNALRESGTRIGKMIREAVRSGNAIEKKREGVSFRDEMKTTISSKKNRQFILPLIDKSLKLDNITRSKEQFDWLAQHAVAAYLDF